MAIDVDKIIKYVLHNQGERITGPFVKQTTYYDKTVKPIPYDPKGALLLLKKRLVGKRVKMDGFIKMAEKCSLH